jgi:pimeloyl-ACP methyl ester carboxylesterase
MTHPEMLDRLIILNVPHPLGFARELAHNPLQQKSSQYAWDYQKEDAHLKIKAAALAFWVRDPEAKKKYIEAFERSDLEAMLNYYKRSFARKDSAAAQAKREYPKVKAPVLIIFGLKDKYVLPFGLNNTWEWLEKGLTLVTVPEAGHFVQHDAADLVTRTIQQWLAGMKREVLSKTAGESMGYELIAVEKKGHLTIVTINRPEVMNAITHRRVRRWTAQ